MAKGGKPKLDSSLKNEISQNLHHLRIAHGLTYETLVKALKQQNVKVSEHAIRAWERKSDQTSATLPSLPNLIALSKVLRVSVDELLGVQLRQNEVLYEIVRRPFNEEEEKVIDFLRQVTGQYPDQTPDTHIPEGLSNSRIFRHLLFSNLIAVNVRNIHRDAELEEQFKTKKDFLKEVRVFNLPGGENFRSVRDFFFAAVAARYLEEVVAVRPPSRGLARVNPPLVGLASGRTIACMMRMTERGRLKDVVLFPMLLTGDKFANTTITGTATVVEAAFRHGDFGVSIAPDIDRQDGLAKSLETADALFFSLGDHRTSNFMKILQDKGLEREQLTFFVGDLLFNPLSPEGQTLEEMDFAAIDEKYHDEIIEVRRIWHEPEPDLTDIRIDLDVIGEHAQQRGLKTVALVCGKERLQITKAMLSRPQPVCNTLIIERELAQAVMESLKQ